jgi:hypothetical protein
MQEPCCDQPGPRLHDSFVLPAPKHLLMVLKIDGKDFPVYWIHYVCWQAMARRVIEKLAKELPERIQCPDVVTQISPDDIWWAQTALYLIQGVEWECTFLCRTSTDNRHGREGNKIHRTGQSNCSGHPHAFCSSCIGR